MCWICVGDSKGSEQGNAVVLSQILLLPSIIHARTYSAPSFYLPHRNKDLFLQLRSQCVVIVYPLTLAADFYISVMVPRIAPSVNWWLGFIASFW